MLAWLFGCNNRGEIVFQKLQNVCVAKTLMSLYILCKMLSSKPRRTKSNQYIGLKFLGTVDHAVPFQYSEDECFCSRSSETVSLLLNSCMMQTKFLRYFNKNVI